MTGRGQRGWLDCQRCGGDGQRVDCIDDLCHAHGRCMHGDNTCRLCEGVGRITRKLARRWQQRETFETVELPAADLRARGRLHVVARARYEEAPSP